MNESSFTALTAIASIVTILDFLLGLFVLFTDRSKEKTSSNIKQTPTPVEMSPSVRLIVILINALIVGGFWGWYLPGHPDATKVFATDLFIFLSLFWFSFVISFRSVRVGRGIFRGAFSALVSYIVFALTGMAIYNPSNFVSSTFGPSEDTSTLWSTTLCLAPFIVVSVGLIIGMLASGWIKVILQDTDQEIDKDYSSRRNEWP